MLSKTLLILIAGLLAASAHGQTNISPRSSLCLESGTNAYAIDVSGSPACVGGTAKLFYHFYSQGSSTTAANIGSSWTVSSGTFTYRVYGPFYDLDAARAQLDGEYLTPVAASSSASSSQTLTTGAGYGENVLYLIEISLSSCSTVLTMNSISPKIAFCQPTDVFADYCDDCLRTFQPTAGKYVVSAWTKQEGEAVTTTDYTLPAVKVTVVDGTGTAVLSFTPSGEIIDGWQQITGVFEIHWGFSSLDISFEVGGSGESALFDDIRIFPFDGSMMTYVYDPRTLRLVAELDERNYAKLYEYDEEGKLVRVKKETEKGIMTITESRENSYKRP